MPVLSNSSKFSREFRSLVDKGYGSFLLIILWLDRTLYGKRQVPAHIPLLPLRPPIRLDIKHSPEYEIHKDPWTKISKSMLECVLIFLMAVIEVSRARTTLLIPSLSISLTSSKLWICIWVEEWISKLGNFLWTKSSIPKSWIRIASTLFWWRNLT